MKTIEIEVAVMQFLNIRQNIVVPNVSWGVGLNHECDILKLTKTGYATEVEIKVSKSDISADKKKQHGHNSHLIKYLYFAVPSELRDYAIKNIPERAGLLVIRDGTVHEARKPKRNIKAKKWGKDEIDKLLHLGCMRILGLKEKIQKNCK